MIESENNFDMTIISHEVDLINEKKNNIEDDQTNLNNFSELKSYENIGKSELQLHGLRSGSIDSRH